MYIVERRQSNIVPYLSHITVSCTALACIMCDKQHELSKYVYPHVLMDSPQLAPRACTTHTRIAVSACVSHTIHALAVFDFPRKTLQCLCLVSVSSVSVSVSVSHVETTLSILGQMYDTCVCMCSACYVMSGCATHTCVVCHVM